MPIILGADIFVIFVVCHILLNIALKFIRQAFDFYVRKLQGVPPPYGHDFLKQEIFANLTLYNFGIFLSHEAALEKQKQQLEKE